MFESPSVLMALDHMYERVGATVPAELPEYQLFEVMDKYKYILVSQKPADIPGKSDKKPPRWKVYLSYHDQKEVA